MADKSKGTWYVSFELPRGKRARIRATSNAGDRVPCRYQHAPPWSRAAGPGEGQERKHPAMVRAEEIDS
jgi:hypothetical protein